MADNIYQYSPLGLKIETAFPVAIGAVMLSCIAVDRFAGNNAAVILFLLSFIALFIVPGIYSGTPSPFEKNRQVIAEFGGHICRLLFGRWNPCGLLGTGMFNFLVYEDGVEVRTFFTAFFLPYDKVLTAKKRWSHFGFGFSIESDLPDVPNRIDLHFAHPDKPFEAFQKRLRLMGRVVD